MKRIALDLKKVRLFCRQRSTVDVFLLALLSLGLTACTKPDNVATTNAAEAPKKSEQQPAKIDGVSDSQPVIKQIDAGERDSDALFKRAQSERKAKDNKQALVDLKKTIELRPDYFDAHMALGSVYAESQMQADSLAEFTKATQLRPKSEAAWESRAWMHSSLKQYDECINAANEAIKINPKSTGNAYEFLAGSYNTLKKYDLALKACNAGIKCKPNGDWLLEMRAEAEDHLDELPAAIRDYKKAIELNPKAWNWLYPGLVSCYDRFLKEKDLN